ncbi:MAG: acyl-CoA/acyl-ACP dehydrogenase [Proteobacteria bacterium]|nr:acyl-CoA/acyl-ACP dehydrogenase [Pseudomonadota bacterium]
MDFDFSEEQMQLRQAVRKLLGHHGDVQAARRVLECGGDYDAQLWRAMSGMGLPGAAIAADHGGSGLGYLELCVIAEELGRSLAPVPMLSSIYLAAEIIKLAGSSTQKMAWLPALAAGTKIGTVAFAGASGAAMHFDGRVLRGAYFPVADGAIADFAIVFARSADCNRPRPFLVDLQGAGVRRARIETIDPTRPHARLELDGAAAEPLAQGNDDSLACLLDRVAVMLAFEQIGGAERALTMARDYALERVAFGRKIGSFQAVKHLLADMFVSVALARGNAFYAAWALDRDAADLPCAAAGAHVSASKAFRHCASNNIQVHGGTGFTWEFDCHLFYRRAQLLALALGQPAYWEARLLRHLPNRTAPSVAAV